MIKTKQQKKEFVDGLSKELGEGRQFLIAQYGGLKVSEMEDLRRQLRKIGCSLRVVKNTLTVRALKAAGQEPLSTSVKGPVAVVMPRIKTDTDPVDMARVAVKFSTDHAAWKPQAAWLDGRALQSKEIQQLAKLPSRQVLLSHLAAQLIAPMANLILALSAPLSALAATLKAYETKAAKPAKQ